MVRLYTLFTFLLLSSFSLHSQCAEQQTFVVCDMTVVDGDLNGTPDGIINLYEELSTITGTTITAADGMWFDPNFNFALDASSGNLFLWDLSNSSETETDYQFEFLDSSSGCPDDIRYVFNIVLGPFSGTASSTADGSVNLQVCQGAPPFECDSSIRINLFQTMLSNPSPHANGEWFLIGMYPGVNVEVDDNDLIVNVPYQPAPPLVVEEIFELEYRVPGITPCDAEQITTVNVAVTKEPFAGYANNFVVCETELLAGDFDGDIDLRDDAYLVNENLEGTWSSDSDPTGQISGLGDSIINLREIYDDLVATNPEFGCVTYNFNYSVATRPSVCSNDIPPSIISFTFYEYIRPFVQDVTPEICVGDDTNATLNLYDYIEFALEGTTLFDYPNNRSTNWRFISGPSDLGLVSNVGSICEIDPVLDAGYTSQGTIDISQLNDNSTAGTYVFEFTVDACYHCDPALSIIYDAPDGCSSVIQVIQPCDSQTARVALIVNPINYAGENTEDDDFCETESLVLTDLLDTNGTDTVYVGPEGIWTNLASGDVITNNYTISEITTGSQVFNFEYNTTTSNDCADTATLSFTVYQQYDPGENGPLVVCTDGGEVDLFTLLGGTPDTNGSWTGPNGYTSSTNVALFDPALDVEGDYIYTVPENVSCPSAQTTVMVTVSDSDYAGEDTVDVEICQNVVSVDLIALIDTNGTDTITVGGIFTDASGDPVVNPFVFPTGITGQQSFSFTYTTPDSGGAGCQDEATLSIIVFEQFTAGTGGSTQLCTDAAVIDLFSLLTNMPDTNGTWSGPDGFTTTDNIATFDPATNSEGDYIYTVPANGTCEAATATVIVDFFAVNYAGENTTGVEVCEVAGTIDLTTLLETNGTDDVYTGPLGVWTDGTGMVITNPFVIPTIAGSQTFDFIYDTTTADSCADQSTLNFTIFEQNDAGTGTSVQFCENEGTVNLFDLVSGTPDTNGSWTGPEGYTGMGTTASINLTNAVSGDYIYTITANGACEESTATINVVIFENSNAGNDIDTFVCPGDYTLDLSSLLDDDTTPDGEFIDLMTNQTVPSGIIDVGILGEGVFTYLYLVSNGTCPEDDAMITFSITGVSAPTVSDREQFYCINDGFTLGDLIVNGTNDFVWYAFAEAGEELSLSTLLVDGQTYFVAARDDNGCDSTRVPYTAEVVPLSDGRCQIDIPDGVSDNDDGINDEFTLGALPDIFPNFEIQIFNRYGTIVYRGARETSLFDGTSNTGSSLGDQLPTGVYFYIFYPNDNVSEPIDGSFYLSR